MKPFGTRKPCMCAPAVTRSTPRVAPRFGHGENDGTWSSDGVSVPFVSMLPTASSDESYAGSASAGAFRCDWNP